MSLRPFVPLVVLSLLVALPAARAQDGVVPPTAVQLAEHVQALAAPPLEGRRSGTPGGDRAARYLADRLAAAGLRPGGDDGTFLQSFPIAASMRLADGSALDRLSPEGRAFALGREWTPHGGSRGAEVTSEIVFVGHGVVAPDGSHDDYASVDVHGRIVLALDGAPPHLTDRRHSRLDKLLAARRRGAAALLLTAPALPTLGATAARVDLVSAALTPAAADALLASSGRTVGALAKTLADSRAPGSFATGVRARLRVELAREEHRALNVIGVLPGRDPALAREAVVLGAHYDHLGLEHGALHPGADDNASGTAVVLGLARAFAAAGGTARTLVIAFFGAEELGVLGARHYVQQPTVPLDRTVAMLNFDMVGRLRENRLYVGGADSGTGLRDLVAAAALGEKLDLVHRDALFAPSDHTRFYDAGTPVLFFFTGGHADYHKPTDTADRINAAGLAQVAALAARVVARLGHGARPAHVTVAPSRRFGARGDAFLGVMINQGAPRDGLWLADVLAGTAAARARFREGDVIVRLAGAAVENIEELRAVLRGHRPGDTVAVVYVRDGVDHVTSVTLGARP